MNSTTSPRATRAAVQEAIKTIRSFWQSGCRSHKKHPGRMAYGEMNNEAVRWNLNPEKLRKARAFAAAYSKDDVARLCKLVETHQFAVGLHFVIRLLGVPKKHRRALERETIEGHWDRWKLDTEIMVRFGKRRAGGGVHWKPTDPAQAAYQVARVCQRWRSIHRLLVEKPEMEIDAGRTPATPVLAPDVAKLMVKTDGAVRKLHAAVLNDLQAVRRRSPKRATRSKL